MKTISTQLVVLGIHHYHDKQALWYVVQLSPLRIMIDKIWIILTQELPSDQPCNCITSVQSACTPMFILPLSHLVSASSVMSSSSEHKTALEIMMNGIWILLLAPTIRTRKSVPQNFFRISHSSIKSTVILTPTIPTQTHNMFSQQNEVDYHGLESVYCLSTQVLGPRCGHGW
jgi:hypothetical protein